MLCICGMFTNYVRIDVIEVFSSLFYLLITYGAKCDPNFSNTDDANLIMLPLMGASAEHQQVNH